MKKLTLLVLTAFGIIQVKAQWSLTGNAGTTPTTNFIGTTDNVDLIFKRSNIRSGLLNTDNTSFGVNALNPNSTGRYNTAIGSNALKINTSGGYNAAYGVNALFNNSQGEWNTAIGVNALYSNYSANKNTAVGVNALYNTNVGENTAVGVNALYTNYSGGGNTAVGNEALYQNSSGNNNTAIGGYSLRENYGSYNTALGWCALRGNKSANNNTAIGYSAMNGNETGSHNTSIGYLSLRNNKTGNYNTALGNETLYQNTAGTWNLGNGIGALYNNTTGNNNTADGAKALFSNTTGSNNSVLGYNTGIGITTGKSNTILGANVTGLPSDLNNTVILADGDGNRRVYINNNGNTGIGTSTPRGLFDVAGTGDIYLVNNPVSGTLQSILIPGHIYIAPYNDGSNLCYIQARRSDNTGSTNLRFRTTNAGTLVEAMSILSNGNVGIGTTNPTQKLSVNGTIQAKDIIVETGWSDFVFDDHYKLSSLEEVEKFIKTNKHLPEIPSQSDVEKNGVALGNVSSKLLMKIEELTLYIIEINKKIEKLEQENAALKSSFTNVTN